MPVDKPLVAISRCLLGERVRYNAELKHFPELLDFVREHFELVPVCPEVEMGLGVPRPPVQMVQQQDMIHLVGRDDPQLDITRPMLQYCAHKPPELTSLHGGIFKSRSPSCGLHDTPRFDEQGKVIGYGAGMFAGTIAQQYPQLPLVDEEGLDSQAQRSDFLQRVLRYQAHVLAQP